MAIVLSVAQIDRLRLAVATLVLACAGSPAWSGPTPTPLAQQGKWEVNYDTDACHLDARFGSGNDEIVVRLTRFAPGDSFDLTMVGRRMGNSYPSVYVKLDFGLGEKPRHISGISGTLGGKPMVILRGIRFAPPATGAALAAIGELSTKQEAAISQVDVQLAAKPPLRLMLGPMNRPMAALRTCIDDLIVTWGYDPVVRTTLQRGPTPSDSPGSWIKTSDYPAGANFVGNNGLVTFRLDIAADGAVAGCHILYRTDPDKFADTTCRIIAQRARFSPALDAAGNGIKWFYVNSVRWVVPQG